MRHLLIAVVLVSVCRAGFASDIIQCDGIKPVDVPNFQALAEASANINRDLCKALFNPPGKGSRADLASLDAQWRGTLVKFAEIARTEALRIEKVTPIEHFERPFTQLREKLDQGNIESMALPDFSVDRDADGSIRFHFQDRAESASIALADNEACKPTFKATCADVLTEYGKAFEEYKSAYSKLTAGEGLEQLDELSSDWREFFSSARSQTFFDLGLTTIRESEHFKQGYLVGPPGRQWFFMHPNVIYEHLSDAPDGFQTKPGIALEIVGINYWKKEDSPLPWPVGVSIASSFVDRPETDDVGFGFMFHVNNRYSLGVSHYDGGEYGIYLTIDLLNAVNNKREVFNGYKSKMLDKL